MPATPHGYEDENNHHVVLNNPRTDGGDEVSLTIEKPIPQREDGEE